VPVGFGASGIAVVLPGGDFVDEGLFVGDASVADANLRSRYAALGSVPHPSSPADFGKLIADETEKWGKVIRAANIKPD
jgi:hypothetical protein